MSFSTLTSAATCFGQSRGRENPLKFSSPRFPRPALLAGIISGLDTYILKCTKSYIFRKLGLPMQCSGEEFACQYSRCGFNPWVGKISWRRKWQPTPVFLPEKSHGLRSLVGCSPRDHKELDTTEQLSVHAFRKLEQTNMYSLSGHRCNQLSIHSYQHLCSYLDREWPSGYQNLSSPPL